MPESWVREATREQRLPYLALGRYRRYQRERHRGLARTSNKRGPQHAECDLRSAPSELVMSTRWPASEREPSGARVWCYQGKRGIVWRIRYRDASGRRILETLGKEPAWNRKRAEQELRRRLVDVERDGYRKPEQHHSSPSSPSTGSTSTCPAAASS